MRINLFIVAFFLCVVGLNVSSVDLENVNHNIQTIIPIGIGNGSLKYLESDPNEPVAPTKIQIRKNGKIYIVDFHQGINEYDTKYNYIKTYNVIGCDRVSLSDNYLVAWNSTSSNPELTIFTYDGSVIGNVTRAKGRCELYVIGDTIYYHVYKRKVYGINIMGSEVNEINEASINENLLKDSLRFDGTYFIEAKIGLITSNGETFFRITSNAEMEFANTTNGKDRINIARTKIFAIDNENRRYLFYFGEREARISIANKNGELIKVMKPLIKNETISIPCVLNNGDICYVSSSSQGHAICFIKKTW